jgi:hypothetical protein
MRCILIVGLLVLSTAPVKAQLCGPDVAHSTKRVKQKSQLETEPPQDKAVVYVLAPTYEAGYTQQGLIQNRTEAAATRLRKADPSPPFANNATEFGMTPKAR